MKHTLLAAFAAVFLFSGLTGFPTVVTVTPALAQGSDVLVQDGLRLPRSHQYELYNHENASYGIVRVETVPSYLKQGMWIYDRTAGAWVSHPSVGNPNPQYAASGRDFRREASASDQDVLVQDGLRLPRSHQYELYNTENASYGTVRVETVPSYLKQGMWIYDRTAGAWVSHPSVGNPNPHYAAASRDSRREELLGQREVDFRADRDVIEVGRDEGRFQKIRIVVRGAPIQLRDLKVIFADDSVFDPVSRDRILREDSAYVFDLPGHRRIIKRITFLYRSIDRREGKATVLVYGEH